MTTFQELQISSRAVEPHKAFVSPQFGSRHVLTQESWSFVSLWLRRHGHEEAHFYWEQSRQFHGASSGLPLESAPLLLYYSFLNAAKALLASRSIRPNPLHGVSRIKPPGRFTFKTAGVEIKNQGVLPSLSQYFEETETAKTHTLPELFFNMPFIHRTFCLTYKSQPDMFIPLTDAGFQVRRSSGDAFFCARLSQHHVSNSTIRSLPSAFVPEPALGSRWLRSTAHVQLANPRKPNTTDVANVAQLHHELREDLFYINGSRTLWYAKGKVRGPARLNRQSTTLTLAAMHCLSELSRYEPMKLAKLLTQQKNWLISEFIRMSPEQFIDEIASEITGHQFLVPNVRIAL